MFKSFCDLDVHVCIEGEDWIPAGTLFHKFIARGKNEHSDDDRLVNPRNRVDDASKLMLTSPAQSFRQ